MTDDLIRHLISYDAERPVRAFRWLYGMKKYESAVQPGQWVVDVEAMPGQALCGVLFDQDTISGVFTERRCAKCELLLALAIVNQLHVPKPERVGRASIKPIYLRDTEVRALARKLAEATHEAH